MSALNRLRAERARVDAEYAEQERKAAERLASIRYMNARDSGFGLSVIREIAPAPGLCVHCLELAHVRKP